MKIAGIDVHKIVLMVVVIDASTPEEKPTRRAIGHDAERVAALPNLVTGAGGRRGGHGIHRSVLPVGVAGVGAPYAFALGSLWNTCHLTVWLQNGIVSCSSFIYVAVIFGRIQDWHRTLPGRDVS